MTSITSTLKMRKSFFNLNPGTGYSDLEESLLAQESEERYRGFEKKLLFLRYLLWKSLEYTMLIYTI